MLQARVEEPHLNHRLHLGTCSPVPSLQHRYEGVFSLTWGPGVNTNHMQLSFHLHRSDAPHEVRLFYSSLLHVPLHVPRCRR